ncbi:MAG: hypothetical protein ACK4FJ_06130 [Ferrovibrio sp.]|uniref:hypothetical protein n=1 Tax=Ferrovibrio sp. TaxID=1917215 RepID=UPI00391AADB2
MKTPKTPDGKIVTRYLDLMVEIKQRIAIIDSVIDRSEKGGNYLPPRATYEVLYLQLRYICELIALGSLLMHEDIPATRSATMMKTYAADHIMTMLHKLKPDFYPTPIAGAQTRKLSVLPGETQPRKHHHITPLKEGYLGRDDLKRLYAKTGEVLHQGTLKTLLSGQKREIDFTAITDWRDKIIALLKEHIISIGDGDVKVIVQMRPLGERAEATTSIAAPAGFRVPGID